MMTTGTSPSAPPDALRRWAAETLDLAQEADRAAARARLFDWLAEADFVPNTTWLPAYRALAGRKPGNPQVAAGKPAPQAARQWAHDALREEVEKFAEQFFQLSVDERRARWAQFRGRFAANPSIAVRLAALAPALEIDSEQVLSQHADCADLLREVLRLFVLRPQARAAERQRFFREQWRNIAPWERAAKSLRATAPALAALEPDLTRQLDGYQRRKNIKLRRPLTGFGALQRLPTPLTRFALETVAGIRDTKKGKLVALGAFVCLVFIAYSTPSENLAKPGWKPTVKQPSISNQIAPPENSSALPSDVRPSVVPPLARFPGLDEEKVRRGMEAMRQRRASPPTSSPATEGFGPGVFAPDDVPENPQTGAAAPSGPSDTRDSNAAADDPRRRAQQLMSQSLRESAERLRREEEQSRKQMEQLRERIRAPQ